ncbi:membrane protein [soil metagenome]
MRKFILLILFTASVTSLLAQKKHKLIDGMYFQWGYNTEWYTKSDIHVIMPNGNNFKLINAKAHDRPDLDAIPKKPLDISIPQYNYRLGFYLNKSHSKAIELNFDHAKYIVTDGQTVRVKGTIDGKPVDADSVLNPTTFLHFEHTDGANWLHLNYVQQHTLLLTKKTKRPLITYIWKAGAGINIPRTDFTWRGDRLNNDFHVAGYNISVEGGARIYPLKRFFFEFTGKTGYVKYLNALSNYNAQKGIRVRHSFEYFELIGLVGYDIKF